ncbi:universal stress protein [Streptomyces venezuelae]
MPHDIVAGVDGSPAGLAAAHGSAQEALRRGTGLSLVHAWHRRARPGPNILRGSSEHDWAEQLLRQAVHSVRAAHPDLRTTDRLLCDATVTALLRGDPANAVPRGPSRNTPGPSLRRTDRVRFRGCPAAWHRPAGTARFPCRLLPRARPFDTARVRGLRGLLPRRSQGLRSRRRDAL